MIAGISVKFNENTSRVHHIPGSGPQGTLLGVYWSTSYSATTMLTVLMKPSGLNMKMASRTGIFVSLPITLKIMYPAM